MQKHEFTPVSVNDEFSSSDAIFNIWDCCLALDYLSNNAHCAEELGLSTILDCLSAKLRKSGDYFDNKIATETKNKKEARGLAFKVKNALKFKQN